MILRTNRLQEGTTLTEDKGKLILNRVVNLDDNLKACHELRKDDQNGWTKDRSMRRVASVPFDVWNMWVKQNPELLAGDKELREKTLRKLLYQYKEYWTVGKGV